MSKPITFYIGMKSVVFNPNLNKALVLIKIDQLGRKFWDIVGGRINNEGYLKAIRQALQ